MQKVKDFIWKRERERERERERMNTYQLIKSVPHREGHRLLFFLPETFYIRSTHSVHFVFYVFVCQCNEHVPNAFALRITSCLRSRHRFSEDTEKSLPIRRAFSIAPWAPQTAALSANFSPGNPAFQVLLHYSSYMLIHRIPQA